MGIASRLRSLDLLSVVLAFVSSFVLGAWMKRSQTTPDLLHVEASLLTVFAVAIGIGLAVSTLRAMERGKPATASVANLIAFVLGVVIGLIVTAPVFVPPRQTELPSIQNERRVDR